MIEINGSYGEGGGQVLRTSLCLSCMLGRPFRIHDIRKGRKKPGLMAQHLTAVRASQVLSGAEVVGDRLGSTALSFIPGRIRGEEFSFDIGTAGSVSLVIQTLLPALLTLKRKCSVTITGGTHVPFSPSVDYLRHVFAPMLHKMGVQLLLSIDRYGFYPKGGGRVVAKTSSSGVLKPMSLDKRGRVISVKGYSGVAHLPVSIAERQKHSFMERIRSTLARESIAVEIEAVDVPAHGQGTFLFAAAESEQCMSGFSSLGERGKRAEIVGDEAADEFIDYYRTGSAVDPHLADQIVLYLAFAEGESSFSTSRVSNHLLTNLWVISMFHKFGYAVSGDAGHPGKVTIAGAAAGG